MVEGSKRYDVEMTQSKCSMASLAYSGLLGCTVLALVALEAYHALYGHKGLGIGINKPTADEIAKILDVDAWTFRIPDEFDEDFGSINLTWVQRKSKEIEDQPPIIEGLTSVSIEYEDISLADSLSIYKSAAGTDVRLVIHKTVEADGEMRYTPWVFMHDGHFRTEGFTKPAVIERLVDGTSYTTDSFGRIIPPVWGDNLYLSTIDKEGISYQLRIDFDGRGVK